MGLECDYFYTEDILVKAEKDVFSLFKLSNFSN